MGGTNRNFKHAYSKLGTYSLQDYLYIVTNEIGCEPYTQTVTRREISVAANRIISIISP
ncbi:hypothetical protein D3C75_1324380 [compost metagenome]